MLHISGKELLLSVSPGSHVFHLVNYPANSYHFISSASVTFLFPSHFFCHFTHLYPLHRCLSVWLFTPWKCQLNGAGLVSSASSKASVSTQGCVPSGMFASFDLSGFTQTGCCLGTRHVQELVFTSHLCSEVRSHGQGRSGGPDSVVNLHTSHDGWVIWR